MPLLRSIWNLWEHMVAEGAGFEPALPFGKHAFQACALSHSATPPIFSGHYRTRLVNAMLTIINY